MNANARKLNTDFGPENRFELRPTPVAPYRAERRAERETLFEQLKGRLIAARLQEVWEPALNSVVRRAANEAAAIAWLTPYPLLLFPALFEERAAEASEVATRQADVRKRSRELLAV